ncbi:MAG: hypothetical protein ACP5KV_03100 [Candidatus Methanomethylicaceae archaeon]
MGGFGTVFAVAMVGMIVLVLFGSTVKFVTSYAELINYLPRQLSSPQVDSGYMSTYSIFYVNVTMYGNKGIPISKLELADILVSYRNNGNLVTIRLDKGSGWEINRVLVGNRTGDLINPINLEQGTGIWDPGETLELAIFLPSPSDNAEWYFVMMLPDGGECSWAFS